MSQSIADFRVVIRPGKLAAAGSGTLLLKKIDALGLEQQANLLRVIETGEFVPVGSNETQYCMARIIVTSHSNLKEAVERGTFRRDLYGCLSVMSFHLQPLRERVQDIAALVRATGKRFNAAFVEIHPLAMAALEAFPWPGNIPELENVLRQAVLRNTGRELLLEDLPHTIQEYAKKLGINSARQVSGSGVDGQNKLLEQMISQRLVSTPSLLPMVERIALACSQDTPVLLTGEAGTGKTYLARLIHEFSPRKDHPFLVVPASNRQEAQPPARPQAGSSAGQCAAGCGAYLIVLKGLNAKQRIRLDKDRVLLGRNANCDIVLPANDFAVSREHACIQRVQGNYFIEDMGSRNGTVCQ